ncbi:PQQ-binding-like beta-propeller repeat protein [Kribbella catacumbae]|uniref:outer membrane protein assembly factor BamB family protein n=1 Tax=Kribbella catacumbae TaxID=460086 RepID=UPI000361F331|nr:PQQ-binding-like beta-propeller repeat protein [Kribbella catacumbae]
MNDSTSMTRRRAIQLAAAALTAAGTVAAGRPAQAAGQPGSPVVTDLGPGVSKFSLMSGLLVGDTFYIGSRNLDPPRVIGYHLPTRKVVSRADLSSGYSIQALAADPEGRYLYAGVLQDGAGAPNLHRIDLTNPGTAQPVGRTGERDIRDLSVAPDGVVYAVGGDGGTTAPALWEYDPATGLVRSLGVPDAGATLAQAVAATGTTVFFGAGSVLSGGGGASRATLFAFDRATGVFTSVLPTAFATAVSVTDLQVLGEWLAVGLKGPGKSVLMALGNLSSYETIPRTGVLFRASGDMVYFANNPNVYAYSRTTKKITTAQDGQDLGTTWGLGVHDGTVVSVSDYGFVAAIDPVARSVSFTDLGEAGAPADPQLAMGIAAGAGYAYVGGTGTVARHPLDTGDVVNLQMPGEAKDGVVVDGVLFTGQYNNQGMWSYDPLGSGPARVASFPVGQNRPLDVCWDAVNQLVLVGVQSDTSGGGCFAAYDVATRQVSTWVNPIDSLQMVRAVATREGIAFLGGDNIYDGGPRSTVVAFDPLTGTELWRLDPGAPYGIAALAVQGHHLYCLHRRASGLTVIDLKERSVVHRADMSAVCTDFGALVTNRGVVFGVSDTTLFQVDPSTFKVRVVVADINGGWYSGPHITNDELGRLYTMRGRNLVRIEVRAPAARR